MSGNPYLDAYAQQEHLYGSPVGVSPRLSRRLARLKRLQELQTKQSAATEAQSTFGQAPTKPSPVDERMKVTQDKYESEMRQYGQPEAQTAADFANTRDPRMVQLQLDQEAQDEKDRKEFWSAVEAGSQPHIDAALEGTAPAWENLRKQKAEVEAAKAHLSSLDPSTQADEILRAKPVLESAYKTLAEEEKRLNDFAAKVEAGINARHAMGKESAAGMDTIGARYRKVAIPTVAWVSKQLSRPLNVVAGSMGTGLDVLQGKKGAIPQALLNPIKSITGEGLFDDKLQARGELFREEAGSAAAATIRGEGEGLEGIASNTPLSLAPRFAAMGAEKLAGFADGMSGMESLIPGSVPLLGAQIKGGAAILDTLSGAEKPEDRYHAYTEAQGRLAVDTALDPLTFVDLPVGKILKPFEKWLDKVKPAMLPKLAGKIRGAVLGGHIIEDPLWAKSLAAEQALNLDRTAPMYENAMKAQRELQAAFDALPPEIAKEARDAAPRVLEGIPVAERGGFVETPRTLKGREAAGPEQIADYNRAAAEQGNAADAFAKAQKDANAASDDLMKRLRPEQQKAYREWERAKWAVDDAKASGVGADVAGEELKRAKKAYFDGQDAFNKETGAARDAANAKMRQAAKDIKDAAENLKKARSSNSDPEVLRKAEDELAQRTKVYEDARKAYDAAETKVREANFATQDARIRSEGASANLRQARRKIDEAERVVIDKAPSEKYAEILKDIPPEHRAAAVKYAEAVGNDAAALAAMAKDRGISLEMASDRLQGYSTRRFTPEYQRWLAQHPEAVESWDRFRLSNLEARNAREYTFHEVEDFLRKETPEFKGDIWSREHDKLAGENWVILADAVKSRNQIEAFAETFGKDAGGNIPQGAIFGEHLAEQLGLRDPMPALKGKWFSKAEVAQLKALRAPDVPSVWRARINRMTAWVSKSVLANPASLAKDVKGQAMNFWNATGAEGATHMDEALRAISGTTGPVDKDLAKLMARGLDRASFDSEIRPAVIDATREFGGSKVAGAIEESGFVGAGIRGIGAGMEKIPGLRTIGAGVQSAGKGVGKVGRALLDGRQQSERVFRLATFKHAKAQGFSDAEALNEVVKFWGDFSQLTKVEKKVLRGFVLFFSWQLRALKMSGHQIIDHPFRTRLMLTLMAGNVSDREDFPDWIRRQGGWVMGKDMAGNPRTIDLGAGSVHGPLQDLLQGEMSQRLRTDGLSGVPIGMAQTALRRLAPAFQAPIEYATNYDSFSGGQIRLEPGQDTAKTRTSDHAPASMWWVAQYFPKIAAALDLRPVNKADGTLSHIHMDPTYNWLFNKVAPGIGAQLGPANALADPRKEMWEAASRAFFGTPTYSIREQDLKSRVGAKVRVMTDALRKSVPGTGLAVNQYGGVYFDKSSPIGAEMIADHQRWEEEAKREGLNPDAYKRLKAGSKYQKQLYLIDLGRYLDGWTKALEAPFPTIKQGKDATEGLRKLGKKEALGDARKDRRRALRGR